MLYVMIKPVESTNLNGGAARATGHFFKVTFQKCFQVCNATIICHCFTFNKVKYYHLEKIKLQKQSFKVHQPSWKIVSPVSKSGSYLHKHIRFHCSHHSPLLWPPSMPYPILLYGQRRHDVSSHSQFFGFQSSQLTEDAGFWKGMQKGCLDALPFLCLQHLRKCIKNQPQKQKLRT